ncbi:MAG: acyl transferase [Bacteroidota bacterium]|nr:acyl transferase [Bacteroidota bacterium]
MAEDKSLLNKIFSITPSSEIEVISAVYEFQYQHNPVYRQWCDLMPNVSSIISFDVATVPFMPISFFKTHHVAATLFEPQQVFESSGTTQTINSKHFIKDISIYRRSFTTAFEQFYGLAAEWCVIGLLPSYLERKNSSLVMMVDELIQASAHRQSGFYLYEFDKLKQVLEELEKAGQKTLLIGVTFGLLDFFEQYPTQLQHTVIMETGGMKGRRKELTRQEVHDFIKERSGVQQIHSEYGMTELLSQAYSKGEGRFMCPPWMKVVVRDEEDPTLVKLTGRGVLNVIDLANLYSCAFIATEDVGIVYEDGSFEVWGRLDNSDIRGCSLLVV